MENHFSLFQIAPRFMIDEKTLESAYFEIQSRIHPDKHALASDVDKKLAIQWAAHVNDAYKILKNPVKRAQYLCELNGAPLNMESNTNMSKEFLIQQMEWREKLLDAKEKKDNSVIDNLLDTLSVSKSELLDLVSSQLNDLSFISAIETVRKLIFLEKFEKEINFSLND